MYKVCMYIISTEICAEIEKVIYIHIYISSFS